MLRKIKYPDQSFYCEVDLSKIVMEDLSYKGTIPQSPDKNKIKLTVKYKSFSTNLDHQTGQDVSKDHSNIAEIRRNSHKSEFENSAA